MIEGVKVKKLRVIPDERGRLMEILRADDECFTKFGQVYLTTAYPGVVKAWHYPQDTDRQLRRGQRHDEGRPLRFARGLADQGRGKRVLPRGATTRSSCTIPPLVYHGFKCVSTEEALVINTPTEVYNTSSPTSTGSTRTPNDIPYDWARKDG